jgi:5-methyltetrahydrofolate--homocysteine methyltransferase
MQDILKQIALCVEKGKIAREFPHPAELAGQDGVYELAKKALDAGISPNEILSEGLIAGMNKVGELFQAGDVFLPDVLVSARALSMGMMHLKPYFHSGAVKHKGRVVIGTVQGDLHDIGKRVVSMFFEGGGWNVIDIGVNIPAQKFLAAVAEHSPQAVALSALLTTTMVNMEHITRMIKTAQPGVKVVIGGAPVTQSFADRIGADCYSPDPQGALEFLNKHCS